MNGPPGGKGFAWEPNSCSETELELEASHSILNKWISTPYRIQSFTTKMNSAVPHSYTFWDSKLYVSAFFCTAVLLQFPGLCSLCFGIVCAVYLCKNGTWCKRLLRTVACWQRLIPPLYDGQWRWREKGYVTFACKAVEFHHKLRSFKYWWTDDHLSQRM